MTTVGTVSGSLARATTLSTEKKTHNLKAENYVVFSDVTEDYSPGISLLVSSEELFQREKGGARIYGSFTEKQTNKNHVVNIKRLLLIPKKDISS